MTVEISSEDEALLNSLVSSGMFSSAEHAVHTSISDLASAVLLAEPEDEWLEYAQERVEAGLEDMAAGRVVPAEQFLQELEARASRNL